MIQMNSVLSAYVLIQIYMGIFIAKKDKENEKTDSSHFPWCLSILEGFIFYSTRSFLLHNCDFHTVIKTPLKAPLSSLWSLSLKRTRKNLCLRSYL